jgi:hypothetical protein
MSDKKSYLDNSAPIVPPRPITQPTSFKPVLSQRIANEAAASRQ